MGSTPVILIALMCGERGDIMTISPEYRNLQAIIPDLTRAESEAIRYYWRVFWEKPFKYEWLKENILEWLRNGEGKSIAKGYEMR